MKERTEVSKIKTGRGVISKEGYEAWKKANEAKSTGTAVMLYDPVAQRTVHLLSQAERKAYWMLRFDPDNAEIYEQFPMNSNVVSDICRTLDTRAYSRILSTDFLVRRTDGQYRAYSVKDNRKTFLDRTRAHWERDMKRQVVEKMYWEHFGIPHQMFYGSEINDNCVRNIQDCMKLWNKEWIVDEPTLVKHLIAHHAVEVPVEMMCEKRMDKKMLLRIGKENGIF